MAHGRERGSAAVDFVLVAGLVVLVFVGVLQLALALHVRNTLVDAAGEGARLAGRADRTVDDGVQRTHELIGTSLATGFADEVAGRSVVRDGVAVVEIEVTAPLPVVGLLGPGGVLRVVGHGLEEPQ